MERRAKKRRVEKATRRYLCVSEAKRKSEQLSVRKKSSLVSSLFSRNSLPLSSRLLTPSNRLRRTEAFCLLSMNYRGKKLDKARGKERLALFRIKEKDLCAVQSARRLQARLAYSSFYENSFQPDLSSLRSSFYELRYPRS